MSIPPSWFAGETEVLDLCVVGSGPAGVSAASALIQKGGRVTLVDGGLDLERQIADSLRNLSQQPPEEWDPRLINKFKDPFEPSAKGVPLKYLYGSDFVYRVPATVFPFEGNGVGHFTPTLSRAGFSNVWGAAVLPFTAREMEGWPIQPDHLTYHYQQILKDATVMAQKDDLLQEFPLHTQEPVSLAPSPQADLLLGRAKKYRDSLAKRGFTMGGSRLLFNRKPGGKHSPPNGGCVFCGLCMYGCPYDLIYSTRTVLDRLIASGQCHYRPGFVVHRLEEKSGIVLIHGVSTRDQRPAVLQARRVFLGAGVASTTRIMLESMGLFETPVEAKVSEYFLAPMITFRATSRIATAPIHTLAQVFVEYYNPNLCPHSIHTQLYTYSDLYRKALQNIFGFCLSWDAWLGSPLLGRLVVLQGYLHSDVSSSISMHLKRGICPNEPASLHMEGKVNLKAQSILRRFFRAWNLSSPWLGGMIVTPLAKVGSPGEGRHVGCTFPMAKYPGNFTTDLLGRLPGFSRVHLVDASVLPAIGASTITLTTMANAHRIAWETAAMPDFPATR